jgi:ATP-dependent protease HslVU (ClpYQ) peptidase subunit
MSVVAVKINDGIIEIAGDTQTTWGKNKFSKKDTSDKHINASGKIFQVNGMTIGCAGGVSDIGLLQIYAKTHRPKEMDRDCILDWLVEFKEFANKKAQVSFNDISVHGIMVLEGKVFSFYDFLEVVEVKNFDAVGSGMWLAIGAMELGATAAEAVTVASKYDLFCGGEVTKFQIRNTRH